MNIIKKLAKRILPEIEKKLSRIVDDATKDIKKEMKELKSLAKALSIKPAGYRKRNQGKAKAKRGKKLGRPKIKTRKRRKMSKATKAKIAKALKVSWAKKKGKTKKSRKKALQSAPNAIETPIEKPIETTESK